MNRYHKEVTAYFILLFVVGAIAYGLAKLFVKLVLK